MEQGGGDGATTRAPPATAGTDWSAGAESVQDLLGKALTDADRRLIGVYDNTVHRNDGCHLHGGIDAQTDEQHMAWFDRVAAHPHKLYSPHCKIGKEFGSMLAGLLRGVWQRKWNLVYPLVFEACILCRNQCSALNCGRWGGWRLS